MEQGRTPTWSFKAAVLLKSGSPLKIINLDLPSPSKGQVLVRVAYAGICKSQLIEIDGLRGGDQYFSNLLGHEAAKVVEEVGEGVAKVKSGDYVVISWIRGLGLNVGGPNFADYKRKFNTGQVTTTSEFRQENTIRPILKMGTSE